MLEENQAQTPHVQNVNLDQEPTPTPKQSTQPTPTEASTNQVQTTGKSELLDTGKILTKLELKKGDVVADLGAGGGFFTIQSSRMVGEQGQVYSVDIMKGTLADIDSQARMAGLYNIKTVWSNIEVVGATKIPEASVDLVMLNNILFQSKKHLEMMTEAARLTKSGGKVLVIDWSDTRPGFSPQAEMQVDPKKIIGYAETLGLSLLEEFNAGKYHFGLIFTKP